MNARDAYVVLVQLLLASLSLSAGQAVVFYQRCLAVRLLPLHLLLLRCRIYSGQIIVSAYFCCPVAADMCLRPEEQGYTRSREQPQLSFQQQWR